MSGRVGKKDALLYDNRMWAWAVFIIIEKDLDGNVDVGEKKPWVIHRWRICFVEKDDVNVTMDWDM